MNRRATLGRLSDIVAGRRNSSPDDILWSLRIGGRLVRAAIKKGHM